MPTQLGDDQMPRWPVNAAGADGRGWLVPAIAADSAQSAHDARRHGSCSTPGDLLCARLTELRRRLVAVRDYVRASPKALHAGCLAYVRRWHRAWSCSRPFFGLTRDAWVACAHVVPRKNLRRASSKGSGSPAFAQDMSQLARSHHAHVWESKLHFAREVR